MTGPRDWDKEMAEIDKIIASGKAPSPAPAGANLPTREGVSRTPAAAPQPSNAVVTRRRDTLAVWARAIVGVGGAVAVGLWPYGKSCGTMLYLYLLSTVALVMIGVWTMRAAWIHRRGFAHIGGLLVLLAGLGFAAIEILHRTAYATGRLGWVCQ